MGWAIVGSDKCRVHNGRPVKGLASKTLTQGGKYSKYLPGRLLDQYQQALDDKELLAVREEIALLESRLTDLLKRVDSGESGKIWQELQKANADLKKAMFENDQDKTAVALFEMNNLITRGHSDYATWGEIQSLTEQLRRLKESERKRLVDMQNMITAEQAILYSKALASAVRERILDYAKRNKGFDGYKLLAEIQSEFTRLMGK